MYEIIYPEAARAFADGARAFTFIAYDSSFIVTAGDWGYRWVMDDTNLTAHTAADLTHSISAALAMADALQAISMGRKPTDLALAIDPYVRDVEGRVIRLTIAALAKTALNGQYTNIVCAFRGYTKRKPYIYSLLIRYNRVSLLHLHRATHTEIVSSTRVQSVDDATAEAMERFMREANNAISEAYLLQRLPNQYTGKIRYGGMDMQ